MINYNHYFDWAATTPGDKEILQKALDVSIEHWANPSSIHSAGTDAKEALEAARKTCAEVLKVKAENLFFTSGGTESDHIPLLSILTRPQKGNVVLSAIEHPALREMAKMINNLGYQVSYVNPNKDGIVTSEAILKAVNDDTVYVSVMAVNNETGAIQPIYEIADALIERAKGKRKPLFHVDCVQAAGKIPLDINHKGIDSAAFSAHKICGPRGIGLLYLNKEIVSFLRGGGQEKTIRSGTENLFGATALALCLQKHFISESNQAALQRYNEQKNYTKDFLASLKQIKGCILIPHSRANEENEDNFSPWVIQASFPGIPGQVMERALSADGFYISTGSACSAGHHSRPILDTMGISGKEKESAVRFSFGPLTTKEAMDDLIEELKKICSQFFI